MEPKFDVDGRFEEIVRKYNVNLELSVAEKGIQKVSAYKKRMRKLYDACRRKALPIIRDQDGMYCFSRHILSKAWSEIFALACGRRIVLCTSGNLEKILLQTMSPEQRKHISLVVDQRMSTPMKWLDISSDCRIKIRAADCYQYDKEDFHIAFFSTGDGVADDIASIYEKAGCSAKVLTLSAYMDAKFNGGGRKWRRLLMPAKLEKDYQIYAILYILKKQMRLEGIERTYKEYCLTELIRIYLSIRDFENAFKYMDEYIENGYSQYDFRSMKADIEMFLQEIKKKLANDKRRNIIIRWFDALRYDEWDKMSYLNQMSEQGIKFKNAYTVMPYTSATMRTMLTGKYPIDDKIYEINRFDENTCGLLKDLGERGYQFRIVDYARFTKHFDGKYVTHKSLPENFTVYPLLEWTGICEIIESDPQEKMCLLIHELPETHLPYVGGEASVYNSFYSISDGTTLQNNFWTSGVKVQIEESRRYVDNIFRFYKSLESDSAVDIYMSDHGKFGHYGKRERVTDYENVHICLAVNGKEITPACEEKIFSLINFRQLIQYAIQPSELTKKSFLSEYAVIQQLPVYDASAARRFLTQQLDLEGLMQTTGIITDRDMLQEFSTGKKEYYLLIDLNEDKSDVPEYQERISYLHDLHKTKVIDVFHDEFFAASIMLYRRLGIEELSDGEFGKLE